MAQKDQEIIRKRAPFVDMVVGTGQLAEVPLLVEKVKTTREPQLAVSLGRTDAGPTRCGSQLRQLRPHSRSHDAANALPGIRPHPDWLRQILHLLRGSQHSRTEQSRPPEHILTEVRQLVEQGCKEVTLLGQTVNSYLNAAAMAAKRASQISLSQCTTYPDWNVSSSSPITPGI